MDHDQAGGICNDALLRESAKEKTAPDNVSPSLLEQLSFKLHLDRVVLPLKLAWANRRLRFEGSPEPIKSDEKWSDIGKNGPEIPKYTASPNLDLTDVPKATLLHDMDLDMEMGRVIPIRQKP